MTARHMPPMRIKLQRATYPDGAAGWICRTTRLPDWMTETHSGGGRTIREAMAAALRDEATCEMCTPAAGEP